MEKRPAIIQAATTLFGSIGFDGTTTLAIADEASVTEPLIYYHFKGKDELFTHSLELAFKEYFARLDKLPNRTTTEFQKICRKKYAAARKRLSNYINVCLTRGVKKGEFTKLSIPETTHMLLALINGLLRQRVFQLDDTDTDGVKDATIEFCRRNLVESISI